ncbi:MAG: thioredoxin domain-containing protein [Spirochaetes bacterium]|nr:thioredoxin domain-containing protein [Spirochaetota bacterium]
MENKNIFFAMIITCVVALIDSLYLLYVHYFPLVPDAPLFALCTAGTMFDCNAVNTSAYAVLFGLPLSAWGLAFYIFFITILMVYYTYSRHFIIEFSMLWLTLFAVLLSVVLGFITFSKIKKFCSFCMILWLCNGMLLVLVCVHISRLYNGLKSAVNTIHDFDVIALIKDSHVQKIIFILSIAGIISLGLGYGLDASLKYAYNQKEKERQAKLIEEFKKDYEQYEKVSITVDDIEPFAGAKENPVHIVVFFDFNCGACHRAIGLLNELALKYEGSVALYLRHFPLDGTCNKFIEHTKDGASCHASLVACALYGEKEYHEYIMQLMTHRGRVDDDVIKEVVTGLKKNYTQLEAKANTPHVNKLLQNDIAVGGKLGIHATPTIIINNTKLRPGIPPAYILEMAIKIEMVKKM